ncbi:hypothetical protein FQR65_LT09655 [Abscondita terminalis]|nr:hypothetical protein FQR65_LT09655 [Abscondita terminalis]
MELSNFTDIPNTTLYDSWDETNFTEIVCDLQTSSNPIETLEFQVTVYVMYSVIFLVAVVGNGIICYIVVSTSRMRTVTNYFIMNLAIGDILITIFCVPFTSVSYLQQYWSFGAFLCPVVNYSQAVSVFVSAYTMLAISLDRYIAIMWPLKPRLSKKFAIMIILSVWIFAGLTALPIPLVSNLAQPTEWYIVCDRYLCHEDWSNVGPEYENIYTVTIMFLQYIIPFSVLLFTYTSIGIVIWCHRIPGEAENSRDQRIAKSKRKMVKMMVTVVFVFTVCWLPFNVLWVVQESISDELKPYLWFALHWLAMSHACYNPIIYCYMNSRFRAGFIRALRIIPCCRKCLPSISLLHPKNTSFPLTRNVYEPKLISAVSSGVPRSSMTLLVVLTGLFPPKNTSLEWKKDLDWQPIPYQELSQDDKVRMH